jgi:leader peptidase (prepilin peptidase)/N-methyltransferase
MAQVLAFLVGLALGSFLNVVITRWPAGEPVFFGRSRCPRCLKNLPFYDNVPLISFIWLKGRCRFCAAPIPWRYPAVELAGGLLALGLWARFPASPSLLAYGPFAAVLLTLAVLDLEHRFIPDRLTYPGIILGLAAAGILPHFTPYPSFWQAVLGALAGGGAFFLIGWVYERLTGRVGLGGGDVKLMAMIGAFLGIKSLLFVVLVSAVLGSLAGLVLALKSGQGRHTPVPYGPFLGLAALLYLLGGESLASRLFLI